MIGKYDKRVGLKYLTRDANNKGGTWTQFTEVWAMITELDQFRTNSLTQVIEGEGIKFRTRLREDLTDYGNPTKVLTSQNRIEYKGDDYDIVSIKKLNDFEIQGLAKKAK